MEEAIDVGRLFRVTYLGSHPDFPAVVEKSQLAFTPDGIWLLKKDNPVIQVLWDDVLALSADSRDVAERRITVTRVLLLGALSLVAKKERVISYLVVTDPDGDWIFAVPNLNSIELHAWVQPLRTWIVPAEDILDTQHHSDSLPAPADVVGARLVTLKDLHAQGVITAEEFATRRTAILNEI